jgi:hypothetical protein
VLADDRVRTTTKWDECWPKVIEENLPANREKQKSCLNQINKTKHKVDNIVYSIENKRRVRANVLPVIIDDDEISLEVEPEEPELPKQRVQDEVSRI